MGDRSAGPLNGDPSALVAAIAELVTQTGRLEQEMADRLNSTRTPEIIRSLPGLAMISSARVLGEFGDDPNRYADAKCRKNYAGTSPITRASGKQRVVLARYARNRHLADTCRMWAFAANPGARASYDEHRAHGDTHNRAPEHSATDSSASSTGAYVTAPSTTNTQPGATESRRRLTPTSPGMSIPTLRSTGPAVYPGRP